MPSPEAQPSPTLLGPWPKHILWVVAGYLALGAGSFLLAPHARSLGLNLLNTLAFFQASAQALGRARREPMARRGWQVLSAGLFAQSVNQAWATIHMMRLGNPPPFPSWADLFSLLSLTLIASALLAWPLASASGSERLRKGMDGLGAAMSAFFIGWYFALGPLFRRPETLPLDRWTMASFFIGNATILGTCAYLGARRASRFRGPLGWITLGFTISLLQIVFQVPLALVGQYRLGDPLDLMVLLAAVFMLLAPLAPVALEPGPPPGEEIQDRSPVALILPMLPAATALAFVLASLVWAPARLDTPVLAMATLMAGLGLFRGLLALRDLQRLSASLETRVGERTRDLEIMQEAMLRTERMNAMAVLGAGMAHDLNNALATVRACAELALTRLEEGRPPAAKDLDHILVAADQSAALTRRLMMYGRVEDDQASHLCLRDELAHMETILRMLIGRHISLRLELGGSPMPILGSRSQIEQIFVNLVANARDAMPQGGTITLRLSRAISRGKPLARVEVQDTGMGMTPEVQAQIFNPFFTTKGPGRGTGLGLASVRQLMQELGGSLSVASQPGTGTTFMLRLPLVEG
ncbi:sensor histidine kinase [Geothrix sp. PMB-07]|uniref:sensor histidine kinase n=1 Tax=Geothrix sp. PMB-07 TaxID=3068640 RepID=UPI0027404529|nr:HAMP domain-containing sensor histidine kinase [Geothrix sp. PMB-07]WLT30023.1 HAMP domain-containing sensor histidine kinase [Geothrix sp. PMB-07]